MHDYFFDCKNGRMIFRRRIYVTSVKIDTVRIYSIMSSGHAVRIEDRKNVKHKLISQKTSFLTILAELLNDSCHDMRTWDLTRMYSSTYYETFFLRDELFRFVFVCKQVLAIKLLTFV